MLQRVPYARRKSLFVWKWNAFVLFCWLLCGNYIKTNERMLINGKREGRSTKDIIFACTSTGSRCWKTFFPTVCSFQQLLGCLIQLRRFFVFAASLEALKICQQKLFHCRWDAMRRLLLWFAVCKTHLMKFSSILSHPRGRAPPLVINDFEEKQQKPKRKEAKWTQLRNLLFQQAE